MTTGLGAVFKFPEFLGSTTYVTKWGRLRNAAVIFVLKFSLTSEVWKSNCYIWAYLISSIISHGKHTVFLQGPGRGRKKTNYDALTDAEKPFSCERKFNLYYI